MPRATTPKPIPPRLHAAHETITAAWTQAARDLKRVFKQLGGAELMSDRAIASKVPGGIVSHAPIRLRRRLRLGDFYERPHLVAGLMTTRSLVDRLTQATVLPGTYAVSLRPAGHDALALDLFDLEGRRVLATSADPKKTTPLARAASVTILGIDVDIDPLDDILNPFKHLICLSILEWRRCFEIPPWIWPL